MQGDYTEPGEADNVQRSPSECPHWGGPIEGDDRDQHFLADSWRTDIRHRNRSPLPTNAEMRESVDRYRDERPPPLPPPAHSPPRESDEDRGRSRSRDSHRVRMRSRSRDSRRSDSNESKGKGKGKGKSKGKKDKNKSSSKASKSPAKASKSPSQGSKSEPKGKSSKGKPKGKGSKDDPVDDERWLSADVKEFHENIIKAVHPEDIHKGEWKNNLLLQYELRGEERTHFCDMCVQHVRDMLSCERNKRIFIGPGRDGSSDDKIPVNVKFNPRNTEVAKNFSLSQEGFVKTTYGLFYASPDDDQGSWDLIEEQRALDNKIVFLDRKPAQLVCILHPYHGTPAGLAEEGEDPHSYNCVAAYMFHDEGQDNIEDDFIFADEAKAAYLTTDRFVPHPGQSKVTTFSKPQRKKVQQGAEQVRRQDAAMWSAVTNYRSFGKRYLLAITLLTSALQGAIGYATTFADPSTSTEDLVDIVEREDPALIYVHIPQSNDSHVDDEHRKIFDFLQSQMTTGRTCVLADTRFTDRWLDSEPTPCKGDLAFLCNNEHVTQELVKWASRRDDGSPRCTEDLLEAELAEFIAGLAEERHLDLCVDAAFVGTEEAYAERDSSAIDGILDPSDESKPVHFEAIDEEQDMLDKLPLPGDPTSERKRKETWLALPRRARIAIRRLHRNFRHLPKQALIQMLRASKAPKEYIDAARAHKCDVCESTKPPARTNKTALPKPYTFNHELGVDVLEIKDASGTFFDILNVVDYGTTFEQAFIVREAETNGVPSSASCLEAFEQGWVKPFGWPKFVAADRGMHNRGVFYSTLTSKGVLFNPAALESPEQIGRVERRNQTLKRMLQKVIKETGATGRRAMNTALTECINAINELSRHGGFAPVQWVLGRLPRKPAAMADEQENQDIGAIQAHIDGPIEFAFQAKTRLEARQAFVKWDCGERVQRAYLRNAVAVPGPYKVGDIVSYCRRARTGESGVQWSVGSRIVGFESDPNYPDKPPSTAWVICDGLPVCVATDKIRPCTSAELLAYQYMQGQRPPDNPVVSTTVQQSFIDEREPTAKTDTETELPEVPQFPTAAASSGSLDPATSFAAENEPRGSIAKEIRARAHSPARPAKALKNAPPSPTKRKASPTLAATLKRNNVTGKGVKLLEKIAYLFDEDYEDPDKVAFIQVRLAAPKAKKVPARKPPKKKDGDKNLNFNACTPDIQKGLRKSRAAEWQKWKKFNAGVILTTEELNDLLESGVKVNPMQWIETDKNAHKRRDDNQIPPELKSRLVGCGNFEEVEGLRTDSPTGDADAHNLVFSWCASHRVRIHSADVSSAYLQGKQNDRIILYRIPKGGIPEEDVPEGAVIAARVPIYGTKDAGRGWWLRLKEVVLEHGYSLNKILPTMFALRVDGKIVGVMSSNVDDLLYGCLPGHEHAMNDILDQFAVRDRSHTSFRFCGKEVNQAEDFSITVTAKDNTEKIRPIPVPANRKASDKNNAEETTALRSVVASLAWVARQVRPSLSYRVSKLQSVAGNGCIKDIRECNKVLEFAQQNSDEGIFFSSEGITWDEAVVTTITDASFCNETIEIDGIPEPGRSQQGYIICLAPAGILNMDEAIVHPIAWSSTHIKRVCRATLMAETFAMIKGTEAGARIRAAIVDMRGKLDFKHWEETASQEMGHCWMTDCDSLYEHLMSNRLNSIENKRLAIDLMALRQQIWERSGERTLEIDHSCGDYPRWIDTSVMLADPLTKSMSCDRLASTMRTGLFDMRPTPESLMIKAKNRAARQASKAKD